MSRALVGLLLGVALFSGPAAQLAQPAPVGVQDIHHYPPSAKSTQTTVTVNVVWLPDQATVDAVCSGLAGEPATGNTLACYSTPSNVIYAVEPTSFNDHFNLMILGHEFWHALGATHP